MPARFTLVYRGPLHANGTAKERQAIREALHPQLRNLCQHGGGAFDQALRDDLATATLINGVPDIPRPLAIPFYKWRVGPFVFTPLISHVHDLMCGLEIEWFPA